METALFELKEKYSIEQIAIESHHGNDEGCLGWMLALVADTPHYGMVASAHEYGLVCPVS